MSTPADYPVHYHVAKPAHFTRIQLLVRVVAFCALGLLGLSFGSVFWFGYLALPAFAAIRLATKPAEAYLDQDGARIYRIMHWFAAISAWFALISDRLPEKSPDETVDFSIAPAGRPSPGAAIARVIVGLASGFVLALLGFLGVFVWLWAAVSILLTEHVGDTAYEYLVGLQRWSVRLLAYQASLVDEYPPFSFADGGNHAGLDRLGFDARRH